MPITLGGGVVSPDRWRTRTSLTPRLALAGVWGFVSWCCGVASAFLFAWVSWVLARRRGD